ncbi:unnamed protein product [Spirodela intermedia]|uniref:Uncharacterized protein n=1 Tax=Spirodela intermedia TaxID=51605 RepID=A0A7I8LIP5_SPIIN|nr:unnamed protein product [Spirodela intermedia]
MFSQSLSFPSLRLLDVVNRGRARRQRLPGGATASAKSSPFFLQVGRNDGAPEFSNGDPASSPMSSGFIPPALSRADAVGVIGGVSAAATLNFLEKLAAGCGGEEGEGAPPFIVCRDPTPFRDFPSKKKGGWRSSSASSSSSSSSSPHGEGAESSSSSSFFQQDGARLVENLRCKRLFLESSGARCIVMPCQICHYWHREISDGCSVPFLHVGDCVAKQVMAAKLRPVEAGSNVRIGILASNATFAATLYQEKLQSLGLEVVLPDKATMEHTVLPAVEALRRKDMQGARTLLRIALQVLLVGAVNTIVLASDDLRGLLPRDDPLQKRCIDPVDALARSAADWVAQNSGESL